MSFSPSSRGRLTRHDLARFPGETLFDRIARAVCQAECLPRKELYEAWEVARRTRRLFRGGRVVDLASGHGVLAQLMLLLDDSSPDAIAIDKSLPASTGAVHDALVAAWPRLSRRVAFIEGPLESIELQADDVVVSSHACGALTDLVLERASAVGARVAVLPCCHDAAVNDAGALTGWVDAALAIDIRRVQRLEARGYDVRTLTIPAEITPKNRLIVAALRG
jgi:Methyltransferase domain